MFLAISIVAGLIVTWLSLDFAYSRYVKYRLRRWEGSLNWNDRGVRVECCEYTVGTGDSAILLVHGFNDSPRVYDRMAPLLAEAGFTVRVMRLPGFGVRLEATSRVRLEDWLAGLRGELAMLKSNHRYVFAVGHSLGAALTIATVVDDPQAADGIGLLAPVIQVSNARSLLGLTPYQWHRTTGWLLYFTKVVLSPFTNDTEDPQFRGYPWGTKFSVRKVYDHVFQAIENNRRIAAKLTTPMIMVLTSLDQIIDVPAAEKFFAEAGSNPKKLLTVERSAHAIPLDYGYDDATQSLIEFFQSLMSAPPAPHIRRMAPATPVQRSEAEL
jgi:carboxylesterase